MTLEKPRPRRARIGAATGEARWRLALMDASAPSWAEGRGLRGLWMGAGGGGGGSRARSARER